MMANYAEMKRKYLLMTDVSIAAALQEAKRMGQVLAWMGAQEMALLKALESNGAAVQIYREFAEAREAECVRLRAAE